MGMIKRKRASEIFGEVDPHLTVIAGGTRHRHRSTPLTQKDWDRAKGIICQECGRETLQSIDGLCLQCANAKEANRLEEQENNSMRHYYARKISEGTLDLHRMKEGLL